MAQNEVISYHIFMFPFILEKKKEDLEEKVKDKREIDNKNEEKDHVNFPEIKENVYWERINEFTNFLNGQTTDSDPELYNQIQYYYEHVQPILFDKGDSKNGMESDTLVKQFRFKAANKLTYRITINRKEKEKQNRLKETLSNPDEKIKFDTDNAKFLLKVEKIDLKIYSGNIGILSFHLKNETHRDPEDILLINQYGRRIYPPFLDKNFEEFGYSSEKIINPVTKEPFNIDSPLIGTQFRELSSEIYLEGSIDGSTKFSEPENFNESFKITSKHGYVLPKFIKNLIGKAFSDEMYNINRVLDDRMFVLCWYGSEQLQQMRSLDRTKKIHNNKTGTHKELELYSLCERQYGGYEAQGIYRDELGQSSTLFKVQPDGWNYIHNDFWYRFVFVDGQSTSVQNDILQNEQMKAHTYDRWIGYNSLIGISRYSFVSATANESYLKKNGIRSSLQIDNIKTIYYEMVQLVLAQRAFVLKYSKEASEVSNLLKQDPTVNKEQTGKYIRAFLIEYTVFINRIFHREVTSQEQGIELYDMLQKHLRVEEQAKELEKEIDELHRNADMIEEYNYSKKLDKLTYLGAAFMLPSLIFGFMSANFDSHNSEILDSASNNWWTRLIIRTLNEIIPPEFYICLKIAMIGIFIYLGSKLVFNHLLDIKFDKNEYPNIIKIKTFALLFLTFLLITPFIRELSFLFIILFYFILLFFYLSSLNHIVKVKDYINNKKK